MDPISDMLTSIRNAQAVKKQTVTVPFSKLKLALAEILKREGFVKDVKQSGRRVSDKKIEIDLKYEDNGQAAIQGIKKVSKSGQRKYSGYKDLRIIRQGYGVAVVSTSKGLMTGKEAKKQKLGGEVVCEIY